jgi:hypothetical protein
VKAGAVFGPLAVALAFVTTPQIAGAADEDEGWHFDVTPYVWIPDIEVDLRYFDDLPPGGSTLASVQAGPSQLDGVFLLDMAARKGDWSLHGDIIYLGYTTDSQITRVHGADGDVVLVPRSVDLGTRTEIEATLAQLALGHTLTRTPHGVTYVFAGLRYVDISGRVHWDFSQDITGTDFTFERSGEIDDHSSYVDGVVGLRGRRNIGDEQWFLAYYVDVGAGESELTWQVNGGAGYAFGWGDVVLAYRYLRYDESSDAFLQEMKVDGPLIGLSFHF